MRRWPAVIAAGLILAACSQQDGKGSPVGAVNSPPMTSASPSPSPSSLPVTPPAFACRMPVYAYGAGKIVDSFINFPSGTETPDPAGKQGMYFDRAYSRWVPVPRNAVSPDGRRYVYIDLPQAGVVTVHIVDVPTGKDHVIRFSGASIDLNGQPGVFDYAREGIYIEQGFEHVFPGIWLLNTTTGAVAKVADIESPQLSSGTGVFWYGRVNPADPSPVSTGSSAGILPDEIDRFDVASKTTQQWLYRPGVGLDVLGLDLSGHPVIRALVPSGQTGKGSGDNFFAHEKSEVLIGLSSNSTSSLFKGQAVESFGGMIADSHGLWFGSADGIYLYSASGGLQRVSDHARTPANGCF